MAKGKLPLETMPPALASLVDFCASLDYRGGTFAAERLLGRSAKSLLNNRSTSSDVRGL